jgi:hypothetical protein
MSVGKSKGGGGKEKSRDESSTGVTDPKGKIPNCSQIDRIKNSSDLDYARQIS